LENKRTWLNKTKGREGKHMDYTIKKIEDLNYLQVKQIFDVFDENAHRLSDYHNEHHLKVEESLLAKEMEECDAYVACEPGRSEIVAFILADKKRIIRIGVNKDYHKTKVLDDLLKYVLDNSEVDYVSIEQSNEPLYNFYTSYGFRPTEKSNNNDYGLPIPTIRLKRDL